MESIKNYKLTAEFILIDTIFFLYLFVENVLNIYFIP